MLGKLLEAYGLSVRGAAAESGVSATTIARLIDGDRPSLANAVKLAQIFSVEDGAKLLRHWKFPQAAQGLTTGRLSSDPDVANGWRLDAILGELRAIRKTMERFDARAANQEAQEQLRIMEARDG